MTQRLIVTTVASAALLLTTLAGCAPTVPSESMSVLTGNEILTADLGTDVSARGVVLAAVLLVAGDVAIRHPALLVGEAHCCWGRCCCFG